MSTSAYRPLAVVWSWRVSLAVAMLVYTNVLRWLRESVFSYRCARTQAATLVMACILWLYMCMCCKYANFVEIATCVRAQRCEKRFLSITAIHLCTPTWRLRHRRIRKFNGNIRSCKWSIISLPSVVESLSKVVVLNSCCCCLAYGAPLVTKFNKI